MTSSIRRRLPGSTQPSRPRRAHDPEERFTRWVTIGFIGLIAAIVVIVVVAFAYDYWVGHFKPVASVGGTSITRDQWTDRARLELFRLDQEEQDVREAIAAEELTPEDAAARLQRIAGDKQNVVADSIENLIDLTYKGQLAAARGLSVTDADVDAAIVDEATSPEARRVSVIVVDPTAETFSPSPEERQAAFTAAQEAAAALAAGTAFEEVAKQYSTDEESKDQGGDIGFVTEESDLDPAFLGTLFSLEKGAVTPVVKGADGAWRIGRLDEVRPGTMDAGLEQAIRDAVGWDLYRGQVRKETLASRLEDAVVADATGGDLEQAHAAEIVVEGDTSVAPDEDEGTVQASHILYSPNDDPSAAQTLPAEDPAWAAAQEEADRAAAQLRSLSDVEQRNTAFADRAKADSDDTVSGADGGSLGWFARSRMVPEFADPLFDTPDLEPGDIVGPVKSDFGWHVILFQGRKPGAGVRLDEVAAKLAEGVAFADVAKGLSDGAEAPAGGDLGWLARAQLDEAAADAIFALEPQGTTEPIPLDEGYHIYQLLEKGERPLDVQQQAVIGETAFEDWYEPQKTEAESDDTISRDPDLFSSAPQVGG
jgi:parvulin-like peptidyl-prolyl isomerase